MEVYEYKGRNKRGDVMQGTVEAPNAEGVVNWMTSAGIAPIHVQLKEDPLKDQPGWIRALQGAKKLNDTDLLELRVADRSLFGKPVIAINTATWWHALRANGINDKMDGFGRLMAEF
mgnify:CR=1 FL=1